ncbi:selenide, water dikinase SelD [Larkinella ripae]
MIQQTEIYKLAQFGQTAGFIKKREPGIFGTHPVLPNLLVGSTPGADAVVLETGHGEALVSTTTFSTPTVDDAYQFGRIAAAHALNTVYALGGEPLLAVAILGWPSDHLPAELADQILDASRSLCAEAGIVLTDSHQIESPELYLGITVTGKVRLNHLKQATTATEGCCLYLTKPLGTGILTTALQNDLLAPEPAEAVLEQTARLNSFGSLLGKLPYVKALTYVSDSGLLGQLVALADGSGLSAEIDFHKLPVIPEATEYLTQGAIPAATHQNWERFGDAVNELTDEQRLLLADPQIGGGLLIAVDPGSSAEFEQVAFENKLYLKAIGQLIEKREKVLYVR